MLCLYVKIWDIMCDTLQINDFIFLGVVHNPFAKFWRCKSGGSVQQLKKSVYVNFQTSRTKPCRLSAPMIISPFLDDVS